MRMRGFTLIELVITLALLGLLAMMAAPMTQAAVTRSREQSLRDGLREIRDAIDAYRDAVEAGLVQREATRSPYPPTLEVLVTGAVNARDPDGRRIYFLRRLPRDPFFADDHAPAASTWGLRSYASPPDDPRAGEDVFDVFSTASGIGLNGIPYREW